MEKQEVYAWVYLLIHYWFSIITHAIQINKNISLISTYPSAQIDQTEYNIDTRKTSN